MEYYYHPDLSSDYITLSSEESKHCIKVMHHRTGDMIKVVDGMGCLASANIISYDKQYCYLEVTNRIDQFGKRSFSLHLAVSPTKSKERMEWMVEKAVEIGIEKISFPVCCRSERPHLDLLRLQRIAISAMKQSQTAYIPDLEVLSLEEMMKTTNATLANKMIAWCESGSNIEEIAHIPLFHDHSILLIGPEGDFSPEEIRIARESGFREVKLGPKRLRTETAALYGCCILNARKL